ncbi:hypothetical protein B5807_00026 [Epicoccum nigrum]|uniref:BTB domain-containing protein n=1 Tax=Epicoccum nigrum TaxID=105696 RepID=A0A1Y2ME90_EPING|nr:hypothetical protein B5807_00026 [Epicoccum nigrum]
MAEASREQLLADIKSINKDTAFSDLTIKCGADTYSVHKNVVAARANVFAKALKLPGKEAEQGVIDLPYNEPEVAKLLVKYLYEAEYDPVLSGFAPSWDYGTTPPHTCDNIYVRRCDAGLHRVLGRPGFTKSAYRVYSTTPTRDKGLRSIVCKIISVHMRQLKKPEIEDLMNEFNGLAFGMLFDKAEQAGWCK